MSSGVNLKLKRCLLQRVFREGNCRFWKRGGLDLRCFPKFIWFKGNKEAMQSVQIHPVMRKPPDTGSKNGQTQEEHSVIWVVPGDEGGTGKRGICHAQGWLSITNVQYRYLPFATFFNSNKKKIISTWPPRAANGVAVHAAWLVFVRFPLNDGVDTLVCFNNMCRATGRRPVLGGVRLPPKVSFAIIPIDRGNLKM